MNSLALLALPALGALAAFTPLAALAPDPGPVGLGVAPPPGAVVLFDGTQGRAAAEKELQEKWADWRDWPQGHAGENWKASVRNASPPGFTVTRDPRDKNRFALRATRVTAPKGRWGYDDIEALPRYGHGDARLHVEWMARDPEANSGVYVQGRYEIQILAEKTLRGIHGVGALVDEHAPAVDAGLPDGAWQAYDVVFRAARWKDGRKVEPARISLWWNGVRVHDERAVEGVATGLRNTSGEEVDSTLQPLKLQYENGEVLFRNIWYAPP